MNMYMLRSHITPYAPPVLLDVWLNQRPTPQDLMSVVKVLRLEEATDLVYKKETKSTVLGSKYFTIEKVKFRTLHIT